MSFKDIERRIDKDQTTVSRELKGLLLSAAQKLKTDKSGINYLEELMARF